MLLLLLCIDIIATNIYTVQLHYFVLTSQVLRKEGDASSESEISINCTEGKSNFS